MTIEGQPDTLGYSRTPIMYLVSDSLFTETNFQYIADVYVWQGASTDKPSEAEYSLKKPPTQLTGATYFDIRTLTTDFMTRPQTSFPYPDGSEIQKLYVWVQVNFGYTYVDGTGSIITMKDVAISDFITVQNGFTEYMEGLNAVPYKNLGEKEGDYFLTSRPTTMDIPRHTSMHFFVRKALQDEDVANIHMIFKYGGSTYSKTIDITLNGNMFMAFGVGTTEIAAYFPGLDPNDLDSYVVYGADAVGSAVTQVYNFTVIDVCIPYRNFQFMNRFGVWDNIIFYGEEYNSIQVEREEILHSPISLQVGEDVSFHPEYGQFHMASVHGRDMVTLNTGWVTESFNLLFRELMLTKFLYDSDSLQPFTISDAQMSFKTAKRDKLINYSVGFKLAHTSINTVG